MPECKGTNYTEEFATYLTIHCLHRVFKVCHYVLRNVLAQMSICHNLTIPNTLINKIISIFRFSYCCEGKDNQRQQQQYNQSRTLKVVG